MRKPTVYYHYNDAAFRADHYKEGYFSYKRDGFGEVVETGDEVVKSLKHILDNSLEPDAEYLEKINKFFAFNDANNCKRNFEAICKRLS